MPDPIFSCYYRSAQLNALLHDYARQYPHLIALQRLGQSYEGQDIWVAIATQQATGHAADKPALWVDGNIHATEIAPSSACLYFIDTLVREYGRDPEITRCLDTRAFYICPRLNPDGADRALADAPEYLRSGTRAYPEPDPLPKGFRWRDIDGDGRILMMRLRDPHGAWKVSPEDPRLLIPRDPVETGGTYYRLLCEGEIVDYDGVTIPDTETTANLDFNRNFPASWRPEAEQAGAGPYPGSEPEVQAVMGWFATHPNITGAIAFHTMGGVLLRPRSNQADEHLPYEDLRLYQKIGEMGQKLTGYPHFSIFHGFANSAQQPVTGAFDDWAYDEQGLFAWTVEIWNPLAAAGIEVANPIRWYQSHPPEDDLKLLHWSDRALNGKGYVDWYPFEHPQFGTVELGGWHDFYCWRNPPPPYLEAELARFPRWLVWHLLISPCLAADSPTVEALGRDLYRIRWVIHNTGWLPTHLTEQACQKKVTTGLRCRITLSAGVKLLSNGGKRDLHLGELLGRTHQTPNPIWNHDLSRDRALAEWLLHAPQGGTVQLEATCSRAGRVEAEVELA